MGDISTISPRISLTRSVGLRMPASPIRWYSSRVKGRRAAAISTAIRVLLARPRLASSTSLQLMRSRAGKSLEGYIRDQRPRRGAPDPTTVVGFFGPTDCNRLGTQSSLSLRAVGGTVSPGGGGRNFREQPLCCAARTGPLCCLRADPPPDLGV